MSGLIGNTNTNTFINTFKGMFTIKVPEGTEGAVKRENKNGKVVHEIQFNKLTGLLLDIERRETQDYGVHYQFKFKNLEDGEEAILETPIGSNLFSAIVNRLPNLELQEEFEIVSKYNNEKERALYFVNQDGKEVTDKFQTYDEDKKEWTLHYGFPPWEQITVKGKKTWDNTKQIEFQENVINELIQDVRNNQEKVQDIEPDNHYKESEETADEADDSGEPKWK